METNSPDTDLKNPSIGPYEIVSQLSEGFLGAVFKVRGESGGQAALKVTRMGLARYPNAQARFKQILETLRSVDHANVARTLDDGLSEGGRLYHTMEFIDGKSLEGLIQDEAQLNTAQVIDMIVQACQGLEAALQQGLTHQDVKPANLIVEAKTHLLKVVDFEVLGKLWKESPNLGPAVPEKSDDALDAIHHYMAPEQIEGAAEPDHRADIYALGVIFYHFLAGRPPFDASNDIDLARKINQAHPIVLQETNSDLPEALTDVITRMMARDPSDRYQDYPALVSDLETVKLNELARNSQRWKEAEAQAEIQAQMETLSKPAKPEPAPKAENGGNDGVDEPEPSASAAVPKAMVPGPNSGIPAAEGGVRVDLFDVLEDQHRQGGKFRPLLFAVSIFFVLLIAVTIIAGGGKSTGGEEGGVIDSISSAVARLFAPDDIDKEDPTVTLYMTNIERMLDVSYAVRQFRADTGSYPSAMADLEEKGLVDASLTNDIWNERYVLYLKDRIIICKGLDKDLETDDDWIVSYEGYIVKCPPEIDGVKEEEQYKRQSRLK